VRGGLERSGLSAPLPGCRGRGTWSRAMHAAHAQVMSAAEISVALRMTGATRADVQDALRPPAASLVKTFGPRGTVHLLPAAYLPKWLAALSAPPRRGQFAAEVRMTDEQTAAVLDALGRVLADAELTLDELDEAVPEHAGPGPATW